MADSDLPCGGIEVVDLEGYALAVVAVFGGKWGNAPVGYGQDDNAQGGVGDLDSLCQVLPELFGVFADGAAAILVVDADEQGDHSIRGQEGKAVDADR